MLDSLQQINFSKLFSDFIFDDRIELIVNSSSFVAHKQLQQVLKNTSYSNKIIIFINWGDTTSSNIIYNLLADPNSTFNKNKNCLIIVQPEEPYEILNKFKGVYQISSPTIYRIYHELYKNLPFSDRDTLITDSIEFKFLSYNNRITWYRQGLFYYFLKNNLLKESKISFLANKNSSYDNSLESAHKFLTEEFQFLDLDFNLIKSMVPYRITDDNNFNDKNGIDWGVDVKMHHKCFCSVVMETYNDQYFYTEKLFKPIISGQPFIVFSKKGALAYLRSIGFETFSDVIDESYDDCESHVLRFEKICNEINRLSKFSLKELKSFQLSLIDKLVHNQEVFKNLMMYNTTDQILDIISKEQLS